MRQLSDAPAPVLAWRQLVATHATVFKAIERGIASTGVTLPQALALATLAAAEEPLTPSRLANLLYQESQSVTGLLDRMEKNGWVERHRDLKDRRSVRLTLTDAGAAKLRETTNPGREIATKIFAPLNPAEVEVLIDFLRRIHAGALDHSDPEQAAAELARSV